MARFFTRACAAVPRFVSTGSVPPLPSPLPPVTPCYRHIDNQAEIVPQVIAERLRRQAYAHCDRAPFGWERRLPAHPEPVEGAPYGRERSA